MKWYYEEHGQQNGPVSREEILRLISQQRIRPETLVWTPEFGDMWRPAASAGLVSPTSGQLRSSANVQEYWAWLLLVVPWILGQISNYFAFRDHGPQTLANMNLTLLIGIVSLATFFVCFMMDRSQIRESGREPPGFWWWLFVPGYFWSRRTILGQGTTLFIVSVVILVFNIGYTMVHLPDMMEQTHQRHVQQHYEPTPAPEQEEDENL